MDLPFRLGLRLLEVDEHGKTLRGEKLPVDERVVGPLVLAANEPVLGLRPLARSCFFGRVRADDHLERAGPEHEPDARGLDCEKDGKHRREQKARDLGRNRVPAEGDVGDRRGGVEPEPDGRDAVGGRRDDGGQGLGLFGGRRLREELFELRSE